MHVLAVEMGAVVVCDDRSGWVMSARDEHDKPLRTGFNGIVRIADSRIGIYSERSATLHRTPERVLTKTAQVLFDVAQRLEAVHARSVHLTRKTKRPRKHTS